MPTVNVHQLAKLFDRKPRRIQQLVKGECLNSHAENTIKENVSNGTCDISTTKSKKKATNFLD